MRNVLPRGRASEEGVDPAALLALVEALDGSVHEPHSLMVLRHGRVVTEGWWAPYRPEQPHLLYSLSKSFTSTAVGLAVDEGLLDIDEPLVELLPGFAPDPPTDRVAAMTLRHALTMSTGHDTDPILTMFPWILENPGVDWLEGFLALEPEHDPGAPFTYNQLATYCAARAVTARSGERLLDYLRPRLLEPLGADDATWLSDAGHDLGFAGLHLRTESIAAFGQLCLREGRWGERQLVPAGWMREATSLQVPNDATNRGAGDPNPEPDWNAGYGHQFWMCRHGYRGDGALGQFCIVWPDEDMVIATTAAAVDMQGMLDLIEGHLSGAVDTTIPGDAADIEEHLAVVTAGLRLKPPLHAGSAPKVTGVFARDDVGAAPSVRGVDVTATSDGWTIVLDHQAGPATIEVGIDGWTDGIWPARGDRVSLPLAAAGGEDVAGHLRVDLVLTSTPHRLCLIADPASGQFDLSWSHPPLHGPDPSDIAVSA